MPEPRAIGDQTWKMRFLRRRALVCDAKLGGLGTATAAARAAAEDGSMALRQFLVRRCCFLLSPCTRWRRKWEQLLLAVKIITHQKKGEIYRGEWTRDAASRHRGNFL